MVVGEAPLMELACMYYTAANQSSAPCARQQCKPVQVRSRQPNPELPSPVSSGEVFGVGLSGA